LLQLGCILFVQCWVHWTLVIEIEYSIGESVAVRETKSVCTCKIKISTLEGTKCVIILQSTLFDLDYTFIMLFFLVYLLVLASRLDSFFLNVINLVIWIGCLTIKVFQNFYFCTPN
jgi:hypothetical protein